jgi:hypothetical protein
MVGEFALVPRWMGDRMTTYSHIEDQDRPIVEDPEAWCTGQESLHGRHRIGPPGEQGDEELPEDADPTCAGFTKELVRHIGLPCLLVGPSSLSDL